MALIDVSSVLLCTDVELSRVLGSESKQRQKLPMVVDGNDVAPDGFMHLEPKHGNCNSRELLGLNVFVGEASTETQVQGGRPHIVTQVFWSHEGEPEKLGDQKVIHAEPFYKRKCTLVYTKLLAMFSHCVFNAFLGDLSHILVTVIIYAGNEVTCEDSVVPWIGADGDRGENRFPARLDIHVLDDLGGESIVAL